MLDILQFSKDPSRIDLSRIPFYQMGFGQQHLPTGKQVHDHVASADHLKAKESSLLAGARANNPAASFIGSQLNSQQNYPYSIIDPANMASRLAEDGSPARRRFNYNDYMQNIEQKISESQQRQSSYVPKIPPAMDPFAMGRSPGAAIYDHIESQNRRNDEFKDKVLARLGNIEDSNDNGSGGPAAGMGEGGLEGEGSDDMEDIDAHLNGFEEGLEGSEDGDGVMMDGGQATGRAG